MTTSDHKWAILLELSPDDVIYVTKDNGGRCWDLQVQTYDTVDEALEASKTWKNAVVVPFDEEKNEK